MPGGTSIILAPSDTDPSRGVDLMKIGGNACFVMFDSWKAPRPDPKKDTERQITFDVLFKGADDLILYEQRREVDRLFADAEEALGADNGDWKGSPVCLWVRFRNSPNYVYFDVKRGKCDAKRRDFGNKPLEIWTITATCYLYARGQPIPDPAWSDTISNGLSATLYRPAVPGDCDPLTQVELKDVSTNGLALNGVLMWLRAQRFMEAGDFSPVLPVTALTPGTTVTDTSAMNGGTTAQQATTNDWKPVGTAVVTGAGMNYGTLRIRPHFKTNTAILDAPFNLAAVVTNSGGSLDDGQYTLVVTEIDGAGHETIASDPVVVAVHSTGGNTGQIALTWTPIGAPVDHRVYFISTGMVVYARFNTGSGTGSFTLTTDAGSTSPANPPTQSSVAVIPPELRVRTALNAAAPEWSEPGPVITPALGGSRWETADGGVFPAALPRQEGQTDQAVAILIEARNPGTAAGVTVSCDGVYVLPFGEPATYGQIVGQTNTNPLRFVFDGRRDGVNTGLITDQATPPVNVTTFTPRGAFSLRRGNNQICFAMEGAGGVADVHDLKLQAKVTEIPLYLDAIGLVS